jgi:ATP-dependent Clp protease adaptor protein ClpS
MKNTIGNKDEGKMDNKKTYPNDQMKASFEEFFSAFPNGEVEPKLPSMYDIVLLNDDFTPPDYVLSVLMDCFHLAHEDAVHMMLMMQQHNEVICGTYTREVAETKMINVSNASHDHHYPLRCVIRKEIK